MGNDSAPRITEFCGTARGRHRHERRGEPLCPLCDESLQSAEVASSLPAQRSTTRELSCAWCGEPFSTEHPTQTYCNEKCRADSRRARKRMQRQL